MKFGTSGVRGLATEMTDRECYRFTAAFLKYLDNKNSVAIAGDYRKSTPRIMNAVSNAIVDSGCQIINCGMVPTPVVALFGFSKNMPSIMVTGSHVPSNRNGIKYYMPDREVLKHDEAEITRHYKTAKKGVIKNILCPVDNDARNQYIERYINFFPKDCLKEKKIVVYQHSTVLRDILPKILENLGAEVICVGYSDTFIPVDTEAMREEDLILAKKWAKEYSPDAIVSADGDGDRPLLFDEQGDFISGDLLGILCSLYLKADYVAVTVSCNTAVERLEKFDIERTKIGSPYVIEAMNNAIKLGKKRIVGYEANGGFLTSTDIDGLKSLPTRDAVLPLISAMLLGKSLSEVTKGLPRRFRYSSSIKDFSGSDQTMKMLNENQFSFLGLSEIDKIDKTDGVRIFLLNQDIVHLRPSSNSPELRCYVESDNLNKAKELTIKTLNNIMEHYNLKVT